MGQIIYREYIVFRGSNISCSLACPLAELQACPFPDIVFPPLPLSALSSSPFHLPSKMVLTGPDERETCPLCQLQFASLYDGQEIFMWSNHGPGTTYSFSCILLLSCYVGLGFGQTTGNI